MRRGCDCRVPRSHFKNSVKWGFFINWPFVAAAAAAAAKAEERATYVGYCVVFGYIRGCTGEEGPQKVRDPGPALPFPSRVTNLITLRS